MLETARIMRRRIGQVNGANRIARAVLIVSIASLVALSTACDSRERKAERLAREAREHVARGDHAKAAERLEALAREYPESPLADAARRDAGLYRGLDDAVKLFPERRAREILVQVARAVERYRAANRSAPDAIATLVPAYLDAEPSDPWGRPLVYVAASGGRGYRLASLGADGEPGGTGPDADIVVQDGRFVGEDR